MRPASAARGESLGIQALAGLRDLARRLENHEAGGQAVANKEKSIMNPIAAGIAGALISGMAVYTMGAKAAQVDAFTPTAAPVQTVGAQFVPAANDSTALRPVATPAITQSIDTPRPTVVSTRRAPARQRSIDRTVVNEDRVPVREEAVQPERSWAKTAMIIGGSAAGGAGVGGIVGGKKGAMVGAAIGGGAASIFEATRRD